MKYFYIKLLFIVVLCNLHLASAAVNSHGAYFSKDNENKKISNGTAGFKKMATPSITGVTVGDQNVDDNGSIQPFSLTTIADIDPGDLTVSITLNDNANGLLSTTDFTFVDPAYIFTGVGAAATVAIQALGFSPTENQVAPTSDVTTIFTISVDDGTSIATDNTTTVVATSINNIPTGTDESISATEDLPYPFDSNDFDTFDDDDTGDALGGIRIETINGSGTFTNSGGAIINGDVINTLSDLVFTPVGDESGTGYADFDFRFIDSFSGESGIRNMNVDVAAVMDPPVISAPGSAVDFQEGDAAMVIDGSITVTDVDDINLESATIEITGGFLDSEDELVYTTTNGITGVYTAATGVLAFNTSATLADYQGALRAVRYRNNNTDDPDETARTISFTVNDGDNNSNTATGTVNVSGLNDAPALASTGTALAYDEGDGAVVVDGGITATDVDDVNLESATIQITGGFLSSEDALVYTTTNGITGTYTPATGILEFNTSATLADYQGALRAIQYENTNTDDPDETPRVISFTVNDGDDDSNTATRTINVSRINDAPVLASTGTALAYDEGDGAVVVDGGITATDVDDVNLESATIQITGGFLSSEDALVYTTTNGITGTYTPATGILEFNTSATLADYQGALRAIQYENTNTDDPDETPRIISFTVNDGDDDSNTATRTINVSGVNDAPVLTGSGTTLAYDEGDNDVNIDPVITVADVDDTNMESATISIITNYQAGQDNLLFTNQNGISGNFVGNTMTLTGSSSVANYQTAMRSVRYENDSDDPNEDPRTIRFIVDDGTDNSNNFERSVSVTAQNDPPQVTNSPGNTTYNEGGLPVVVVDGTISVTDVDNTDLTSATISFTGTYIQGEDELVFVPAGTGINGVFNAVTGEMSLTGTEPVGDYQTVLSSLQYLNNAGANPTGGAREITFSITDGALTDVDTKTVFVVTNNSAPVLSNGGIDDVTVDEDDPDFTIELFEEFEDAEDADADLVFAVDNNTNPALFNSTNIAPATGILTLDFADDAFGSAQITVSATDTDGADVNSIFTVTVNGENDPPTTTGIADVDVNEDAANTVINLFTAFADLEDADADLVYSVEQNTLPGLFAAVTVDNVAGTLTLDYSANSNGISNLTIRATDTGGLDIDAPFTVTVMAINDEPLLDDIPDPAPVNEDALEQVINLSGINAGPNESQLLTVTATTLSTGLITIAPVEYTSPQSTGIIRYTPIPNAFGSADIEVCVTDAGVNSPSPNDNQVCKTFTVVVNSQNDNPTIDPVDDPSTVFVNAGEQCIPLSGISAGPGENQTISVFASSSNAALIPNAPPVTVNYTTPDATGEVCYTPLPNQFGQSTIAVTVSDGVGGTKVETFEVNVSPVNQEPTIDPVADFSIDEDATPGPLTLTGISPGPGESQDLDITILSDNLNLFDPAGTSLSINYTPGNTEASLMYTPVENAFGEANITVRLVDAGPGDAPNDNENEITFKITVNPVNDEPTLDEIPDQGVFDIGEEPPAVNLTGISEGPNENQTTTINFSSDNNALVDQTKILVDFDEANDFGSLTYVIEPGQEGVANITVCVADAASPADPGALSFCRTFKVTVSSAPDLEITNVILSLNEVSRGQFFDVISSVRNNGNEDVASTGLNYYLSADNVFDDGPDDQLDVKLIDQGVPADGTENNFTKVLTVPDNTLAATYYIIVVVDKTNNIIELDETNNIFAVPIVVNSNKFPEIEYNNAPSLLLADDQFLNYRAIVNDDGLSPANPVRFFYRGISSDKEFTQKFAEETEETLFQFTLDREEFVKDEIGIEYYFDATDNGGLNTQTELSYTYIQYDDPGMTFNDMKFGNKQGDYQMVSVPLELGETSPDAVFEDDLGPYNKERWRLFRYQGGTNIENKGGLEDILPGDAYWLIASVKPAEAMDTGKGTTVMVTKLEPFVISLKQGWNQIGSPYNFNVSWNDVIEFNNDPVGVKTVLRHFDGSGYDESDMLNAFGGAFVESDTDIDVMIPVIKNATAQSGRFAGNSGSAANLEGEWEVKIDLHTSDVRSRINGLGMRIDASDSNDRYDASSSPNFDFFNNIELKFDHPEYFQKSFSKDIRRMKESEIWEFTVTSNESSFAVMEWGDIGAQLGNKELYLYDIANGIVVNMLTATSYDVNMVSSKAFKVYYGTKEFIDENLKPENIYLGQSYPNPFTNTTHIPFTLAKSQSAYQLELSIFNLMGQKVKALANGEFQAGFYELNWNGQNEKGDVQPGGIYIYKLMVKSPDGKDQSHYGRAILR